MKQISLKKANRCARQGYLSSLNLRTVSTARFDYVQIMHDRLRSEGFAGLAYDKVRAELEKLPKNNYELAHEREANVEMYSKRFDRMSKFFTGWKLKQVGKTFTIELESGIFGSSYDFVAEDPEGKPYAVKVAFTKPAYTQKAGTSNFIGEDVELYALWKETGFQPAVFSFMGKEPTTGPVEEIDDDPKKAFKTFISTFDFEAEPEYAEEKLEKLAKASINKYAEKNEEKCENCFYRHLCLYDDADSEILEVVEPSAAKKSGEYRWTPSQQKVIAAREGETLVLAGAGSGKTSSLTYRIADMVREGIDPRSILAITFTEKGAREMAEKIARYEVSGTEDVLITTFNGFGYELIKKFWHHKYTDVPELIDESERLRIIARAVDAHPVMEGFNYMNPFMKMGRANGVIHEVSRLLSNLKRIDYGEPLTVDQVKDVTGIYDDMNAGILLDIYNDVIEEELAGNKLEYDDQIHTASYFLEKFEDVRDYYQNLYRHVIIDEFQDTGDDQMDIIRQIYVPEKGRSLMVCGDDSQAIFGFRGVGNENILTFDRIYPKVNVIQMVENWRSTVEILDLANAVIYRNGATKKLVSDHHGHPVEIIQADNANAAMDRAFEVVTGWLNDGVPMSDIAVLAKTRAELMYIRNLFKNAKIPTVVSVSEYLKDDSQIAACIGLAGWMKDPSRTLDLGVWLRHSEPNRFETAFDVEKYIDDSRLVMEEELLADKDDEVLYGVFMDAVKNAFEGRESSSLKTFLRLEEEQNHSFERVEKWLSNLVKYNSSLSAEADDTKYNAVTLSTVHAAKGREWEYVVVCPNLLGMPSLETDAAGIVPLVYDEEAIRLYFVAITRAKTRLVICANPYWVAALNPNATCMAYETLKETNAKVRMSKAYSALIAKQKRAAKKK